MCLSVSHIVIYYINLHTCTDVVVQDYKIYCFFTKAMYVFVNGELYAFQKIRVKAIADF